MTDLAELGHGVVEPRPLHLATAGEALDRPRPLGAAARSGEPVDRPRPLGVAAGSGQPDPVDHPGSLNLFHAELIAGAGAGLLLVSLLLLPWFGVDRGGSRFPPRAATTGTEGGWHSLILLRWPLLFAIVVALLPLLVRPAQRWLGLPRRTNATVAALGGLTALLLAYRVLIDLPDPSRVVDQQVGAILGLVGALMITLGGLESMRAQAARARARQLRTRPRRTGGSPGELARVHA